MPEEIKIILQSRTRQREGCDEVQHHHEVSHVLVVHHGVNQQSKDAEYPVLGQANAEQVGEIEAQLKAVVAVGDLHDQSGGHGDQHNQHLYQHQRAQLRAEQHPALHRQRIDDLVEPRIPFPPHQFARIEGDDGEHKNEETGRRPAYHLIGHRVGGSRERIVDSIRSKNGKQATCQKKDCEEDILDGLCELNSGQGQELPQRSA